MGQLTAWTITQEDSSHSTTEVGAIDPGKLYDIAEQLGYSVEEWYGKANSFTLGTGTTPGVCHFLIRKVDLDLFDLDKLLKVKAVAGTDTATFDHLLATRCVAVYANSSDPSANVAYLLTLEDRRHILRMKSIDDLFNVRTPEPTSTSGAGLYYEGSLNAGAVWTWQTLLTRIWDQYIKLGLSAPFAPNASPTLPYTPDGTPENFRFHGVSALEAYGSIIDKINCVLCYNPFTDTFTLQKRSAGQADSGGLSTLASNSKELATQVPKRCKAAAIPEKIRVYFRAIEKFTGSGMDSNNGGGGGEYASADGPYWTAPSVFKDVATGIAGAIAGTKVSVWDDLPAIMPDGFRSSQASAADNASDLTARANAVAAEWSNDRSAHSDPLRRLFTGYPTSVLTGSEISEIVWSDYGDDDIGPSTEYRRYPDEPIDQLLSAFFSRENWSPPAISRSVLVRPRETQIVVITGDQSATENGVYPGSVIRTDFITTPASTESIPYTTENDCWIINIDLNANTYGGSDFDKVSLTTNERFIGRLIGWKTIDADTRPVYVIETNGRGKAKFIEFILPSVLTTSDASKAGCTVFAFWDGADPDPDALGVTVHNYVDVAGGYQWAGSSGAHGYAQWDDVLDRWRIYDLNCPPPA